MTGTWDVLEAPDTYVILLHVERNCSGRETSRVHRDTMWMPMSLCLVSKCNAKTCSTGDAAAVVDPGDVDDGRYVQRMPTRSALTPMNKTPTSRAGWRAGIDTAA